MLMNIPNHISVFANAHGFNYVALEKRTSQEAIYSVGCTDIDGVTLPIGLPHYIIDREGELQLICDEDFHITELL